MMRNALWGWLLAPVEISFRGRGRRHLVHDRNSGGFEHVWDSETSEENALHGFHNGLVRRAGLDAADAGLVAVAWLLCGVLPRP